MKSFFMSIAILFHVSLASAASGVTVEQENYSQDVQWAGKEKFTVTAEQVLHIDDKSLLEEWQLQQKIFKGVRINAGEETGIYLAYAENNEGSNPNKAMLATLCHTLAGPDYYTFSGVYRTDKTTSKTTSFTLSSERSTHFLSTPRIFYFNQRNEQREEIACAPWKYTVKDYEWGTARYVENLICEQVNPNHSAAYNPIVYANKCF